MRHQHTFIVLLVLCLGRLSNCLNNGLGLTPPMGWNSWNKFACNINETLIKETAEKLIQLGLADVGYEYVNIDDCWQTGRDPETHQIVPDPQHFPSGIKSLADYVHQKGLKLGIYSDNGYLTCEKRPGSFGYEVIDAQTYADWDIDYLKFDNCYRSASQVAQLKGDGLKEIVQRAKDHQLQPQLSQRDRYKKMKEALEDTGKSIYFSICNWGQEGVIKWGRDIGNSWRTTTDIKDNWESFLSILDLQVGLQKYASKGAWNDPDMLEVGNGGMTKNEYYAHFSLWALLKAPLLIGCSLTDISEDTLEILSNRQLIAINQDQMGVQGRRIKKEGDQEIWGGPLSGNRYALIFFNRASAQSSISVSIGKDLRLEGYGHYTMRDPIYKEDLEGNFQRDTIEIESVEGHSVEVRILKWKRLPVELQNEEGAVPKSQPIDNTCPENEKSNGVSIFLGIIVVVLSLVVAYLLTKKDRSSGRTYSTFQEEVEIVGSSSVMENTH